MSLFETTPLLLSLIDRASNTQTRARLNQESLDDLTGKLKDALALDELDRVLRKIPRIIVFFDGTTYHIGDGWHRFEAFTDAGLESIECEIRPGTERDARIFACSANDNHGAALTTADKRRVVEILLQDEEWSSKSTRAIAEHTGISRDFIEKVRKEKEDQLAAPPVETKRKGKDGKERKAPKAKAGPSASKSDEPAPTLSKKNPENKSGEEKISPAQRKQARTAFAVVVRFVDLVEETEVAADLALIAESMKEHWG